MSGATPITERECENKHEGLTSWVNKLETRMNAMENKLWGVITLLVGNLVGVIILLVKGAS